MIVTMTSLSLLMLPVLWLLSSSFAFGVPSFFKGMSMPISFLAAKDTIGLHLQNEEEFQKTLKECTSKNLKKCQQYLPDKDTHPHLQRIAFMSTGGKTAEKMFEIIKGAILVYYNQDQEAMKRHVDWNWMTHVPALGYGKSHGWTKIVRFVYSSLMEETIEALQRVVVDGDQLDGSISGSDGMGESRLSKAMRQVIRFHCRISHVAAHTAVFHVNASSYSLEQVMDIVEKVTLNPQHDHSLEQHNDSMAKVKSYLTDVLSSSFIEDNKKEWGNDMVLTRSNMIDLEQTLQEELDTTNGLKKWPCKSFWDIQDIEMDETLRKMASKLSPDCNAPYTTCVVARDKCEMKGNVNC